MNAPPLRHRLHTSTRVAMIALAVCVMTTAVGFSAETSTDESVATTPVGYKPGKGQSRFELLNERVKRDPADLIFVGDSITHYWEARGRDVWKQRYGDRHAVNLGVEGDRTMQVLWRLEHGNVDGITPKLAVVLIGTNNIGLSHQTPEQTAAGVAAVVDTLRRKLPDTRVLLLGIFPRGSAGSGARKQVDRANELIAARVKDDAVTFVNINRVFLAADGSLKEGVMHDGLHLTAEGYTAWADAIEPYIQQLTK
ncbi:MAG: GDSL family lipase [Phycisphaera sp.]|nr:GDSL family lipase [Phycisphaera sp.]